MLEPLTPNYSQKYYINYVKEMRECAICREVKPFAEFSPRSSPQGGTNRTGICKTCNSERTAQAFTIKNAIAKPERYYECSDELCGRVWAKRYGDKCKKCGSVGERFE